LSHGNHFYPCVNGKGIDHRGTKSITRSGKVCQRWNQTTHMMYCIQQPSPSLESNFCRNPDELSDGPWCYTTDPNTRWEYCDISSCTGSIHKSFILYLILFYFIFI
uniref:Kringle domain-containing protein n=1 Tax=Pundamilia nyererei TaxID=303518 RepID=A0A3B4FR58_9CICH